MIIPFRTLRYQPGKTVWGLNIMRNLRRRNELSFWSPISRAFRFTQISMAGSLSGLETRTLRSLKLLPYVGKRRWQASVNGHHSFLTMGSWPIFAKSVLGSLPVYSK